MPKHPNGTPGKKPSVPSVKVGLDASTAHGAWRKEHFTLATGYLTVEALLKFLPSPGQPHAGPIWHHRCPRSGFLSV
jgi:hypothetical protein